MKLREVVEESKTLTINHPVKGELNCEFFKKELFEEAGFMKIIFKVVSGSRTVEFSFPYKSRFDEEAVLDIDTNYFKDALNA